MRAMTVVLVAVGVAIVIVALATLAIYNRLVHLRNLTREAWRDIDTELQRRYDLIPNLVSTVKGYAAHEQQTFEAVARQRADAMAGARPPDEQAAREQALGTGVAQVLAVAEQYPELQASDQFLSLQRELTDTEDRIQVARRIYNANVRALDTLIETFPAMLIARRFGFRPEPFFQLDPVVRASGPPPMDLSGHT
jgi:LemA protein